MRQAHKPRQLFRPNPLLGWKLEPNSSVDVVFRNGIAQTIGADGWRYVPGSDNGAEFGVGIYGCSFTYGTALADEETFCALLQAAFPDVEILNRGVGGYSSVQNLLQFKQDIQLGRVQAAIFAIISDHRYRNIPHPQRMQQFLSAEWYELGIEHVPVVAQQRDSGIDIEYVGLWQPSLLRRDFDAFLPSDRMINEATLAVFDAIVDLADKQNVPIAFALLDNLDPEFNSLVLNRFSIAHDISTPFDAEHTFLPRNVHPNVLANRLFADRLHEPLAQLVSRISSMSE